MKRVLMVCFLCPLAVFGLPKTSLYVAANGNDSAAGTIIAPFATLARARDEIRVRKSKRQLAGPVTVFVRGGLYELSETLKLDGRDSGTAGGPIVYRTYPHENAVMTAARAISGFVPYKGKIQKADTAAHGLRGVYFRQLFFEGKRMPLARRPNFDETNPYAGGWAYADGKPVPMWQNIEGEDKHSFQYAAQDAREWARPEEVEVFVFPRYNWWNNIVRVKSVDPDKRRVTLAADCSYPIRPGDRYYVQNLLEELDAPGEWYLDKQSETLYFWPPEHAESATVYAPRLRTIIELGNGTSYVTFQGLTFEYFEGTAIALNATSHCTIAANTIRDGGDYRGSAVEVDGGDHNGVVGNDIFEIGSNGIVISGGDRITLTSADNYADNNYIHHVGVFYKGGVGVSLNGCGNRASHNLIHDTPRIAIIFNGNNLIIEYNHLHHANLETADSGIIYTGGRDWIGSRGTVVRYNYMHDSMGFGSENGKWVSPYLTYGVYLDDNAGGVDVIGNIVVRGQLALIHLHNARDNVVRNNVFVGGKVQQAAFTGWTGKSGDWTSHLGTMVEGYNSVKNQPAWSKMRNMEIGPEQAVLQDGLIMSGNVFDHNIVYWTDENAKLFSGQNVPLNRNSWDHNLYWHSGLPLRIVLGGSLGELDFDRWRVAGQDQHSVVADPLFVDPRNDNYRLRPNSPALRAGFQPIPVDLIGPYKDSLRASWPINEEEAARKRQPLRERNPVSK
jgi:hypothetical protein